MPSEVPIQQRSRTSSSSGTKDGGSVDSDSFAFSHVLRLGSTVTVMANLLDQVFLNLSLLSNPFD
jgi:hypothetical protein